MRYILTYTLTLACALNSSAQQDKIDSLQLIINTASHDSTKVKAYFAWDDLIYATDPLLDLGLNNKAKWLCESNLKKKDLSKKEIHFFKSGLAKTCTVLGSIAFGEGKINEAMKHHFNCLKLCKEVKDEKRKAISYNNIALCHWHLGNNNLAIKYNKLALAIRYKIKDQKAIASSLNNIANIYTEQGNFELAIANYTKGLTMFEKMKNLDGIAMTLGNIGIIYQELGDLKRALNYYEKKLKLSTRSKNKRHMATANDNLGVLYLDLKQPEKAMQYHLTAIKLNLETEDELLLAQSYNYLGNVFRKTNRSDSALHYYQKSLEIFIPAQETQWLSVLNINIAAIYYDKKDYSKALEFCLTSFNKANEVGAIINIEEACGLLHKLYAKTNQPAKAYEAHLLYTKMRDSIDNDKGKKEVLRQEFKHRYEKQTAADKLINDARIKQEQTQRYALYGGLSIVFIFSFFLYRRFRITQKQNVIIREQKKVVEEKQKEIIDSIHYAKRIQKALLPNEKYIQKSLKIKNN